MKASYSSREIGSVASSLSKGSRNRSGGCGLRGDRCWRRMWATFIGSVSVSQRGFFDCAGHIFRAVLPDQFQQFLDLTAQGTIRVGHIAEIRFDSGT
jgi:hypothetical protein